MHLRSSLSSLKIKKLSYLECGISTLVPEVEQSVVGESEGEASTI